MSRITLKGPDGLTVVHRDRLADLVAQGKLNASSRTASMDGGACWITVQEALSGSIGSSHPPISEVVAAWYHNPMKLAIAIAGVVFVLFCLMMLGRCGGPRTPVMIQIPAPPEAVQDSRPYEVFEDVRAGYQHAGIEGRFRATFKAHPDWADRYVEKYMPTSGVYGSDLIRTLLPYLSTKAINTVFDTEHQSMLQVAANDNQADLVAAILEKKADPNVGDDDDQRAIHLTTSSAVIEILIKHNADINFVARTVGSPLHKAQESGPVKVAEILRHLGAKDIPAK